MISCERRYLSLFFNNTMNEVNDGDVVLRFALPQEFCAANKSKRKIRVLNYQYWTLNDKEGTTNIDYDATTGIRLCADFNQSDPANDNFIMLSNKMEVIMKLRNSNMSLTRHQLQSNSKTCLQMISLSNMSTSMVTNIQIRSLQLN